MMLGVPFLAWKERIPELDEFGIREITTATSAVPGLRLHPTTSLTEQRANSPLHIHRLAKPSDTV